jgi:two-component system OmpR family sensor kinase
MWDIGSSQRDHALIGAWAGTAVVNVVVMSMIPGEETIPFHLVWIGLALVYGFTRWSLRGMLTALGGVVVTTGFMLVRNVRMGAIGWAEVTEVPLMAALFVVMAWHVSRRHQALAETARMAEQDRLRADAQQMFVRLASHELRTPITVARGYTEMIRDAHHDPGIRDDADIVMDELDKLARITQRLVTIMQTDEAATRWPTDVDAELTRIMHRWRPTARRRWSVRSDVGVAATQPERLETAVDCLVENALKFTAPGDRVEVVGRRTRNGWVVEVNDSGTGVDPAQARALNRGLWPGRTRTGTGLGLAIARTVVESWGGGLRLRRRADGGTSAALFIPDATARPAPAPAVAPSPPRPSLAERMAVSSAVTP